MKRLQAIGTKCKKTVSNLLDYGRRNPDKIKIWSVTIAAGVAGGVGIVLLTKGMVAIAITLASPAITLLFGILGAIFGWVYMQPKPIYESHRG